MNLASANQSQSKINFKDAEMDRQSLVESGNLQESQDSQEQIIRQYVKKEQREILAEQDQNLEQEIHQTVRRQAVTQVDSADSEPLPAAAPKSEFLMEIEHLLADDLGDIYNEMAPDMRVKFKNRGEEIARKIEQVIIQGKVRLKQIINWIRDWLKMIPGVNKFFLEQAAKIKSDKVIELAPH